MISDQHLVNAVESATTVFRKGEQVETRPGVVEIFGYPHVDEAPAELEKVDVVFITVGVDKHKAAEVIGIVRQWIAESSERAALFAAGPSYIHLGAWIEQETALRLIALGAAVGEWKLMTPMTLGLEGEDARELAGRGFVYALPAESAFAPEVKP